MTVKETLQKALAEDKISSRAFFAFVNFELFEDFLNLTSKEFFEIFDYYDVYFIRGIGKKSFHELQGVFVELENPFKVSSKVKFEILDQICSAE